MCVIVSQISVIKIDGYGHCVDMIILYFVLVVLVGSV